EMPDQASFSSEVYRDQKLAADHWAADFRYERNTSVRFDTAEKAYLLVSEPLDSALARVATKTTATESQDQQPTTTSSLFPLTSPFHASKHAAETGLVQVLLPDVPVLFYMVWDATTCMRYNGLVAFLIDRLINHPQYTQKQLYRRETILFYAHEGGA